MVKNLPANARAVRDSDLIPGWRRSPEGVFLPGESHRRRSLGAVVHVVAKSQTQLK